MDDHILETVRSVNVRVAKDCIRLGHKLIFSDFSKKPCVAGWQSKMIATLAEVDEFYAKFKDAVPCIPTGGPNDLMVIDIDRKDGKDGLKEFQSIGQNPLNDADLVVQTPSGGYHAYFGWEPGLTNSSSHLPRGVDQRGGHEDGRSAGFVLAPGAITPRGEYKILKGDLPETMIGLNPPPRKYLPVPHQQDLEAPTPNEISFNRVKEALSFIPNDERNKKADDRDYWISIGAALHHSCEGDEDGLRAFQEWSAKHHTYDPDVTTATWESFGRSSGAKATNLTIFFEAKKFGYKESDLAAKFDDLDSSEEVKTQQVSQGIRTYSPKECAELLLTDYIVKGLIAPGDLFCIFGEPGAGKSLLAPALTYQLALGQRVFGLRTNKGKALYVAAEDELGMRNRISALYQAHGDAENFLLASGVSDLMAVAGGDFERLLHTVKVERPDIIVIDTLAMAFGSMEENSQDAMVQVVQTCRMLARGGAAVIIVHHGTKADGGTPRGHSALNGALDGSMQLKPKDQAGIVRGQLKKNRRGSIDLNVAFKIETCKLGTDQDGDPVIAPYAEFLENRETFVDPLTPGQRACLEVLKGLTAADGIVELADWKRACAQPDSDVSSSKKPDSRRKAASNSIKVLLEQGYIIVDGTEVFSASKSPRERQVLVDKFDD